MADQRILFRPIRIGSLELPDRCVMAPMATNYCRPDGAVSERLMAYLAARVRGGVSLVMTEGAYVTRCGKIFVSQMGIDHDDLVPEMQWLTDQVHALGARIGVQLDHGGRQASPGITGLQAVAPSVIVCASEDVLTGELSASAIAAVVQDFADAAERAVRAGFDLIEINGANGCLLNQFLSPSGNHRKDKYGGSAEARRRMPLEVLDAVRARVGPAFPIVFRLSSGETLPGGLNLDDAIALAQALVERRIDAISVSGSTYADGRVWSGADEVLGVYVEAAAHIRSAIGGAVPVIVGNRLKTPSLIDAVLNQQHVDVAAVGRALLSDADFFVKLREGRRDDVRMCISCNHCVSDLLKGMPVACIHNHLAGNELRFDLSAQAAQPKRVLVAGGGASGLEAANIAAVRGHDVALYEQRDYFGGSICPGTHPPFKQEILALVDYEVRMLEKNGIEVHLGEKATIDVIRQRMPDMVVVASGSVPRVPPIPGIDAPFVHHAEDVLMENVRPDGRVAVIGGGAVGIETAELMARNGAKVTVIQETNEILSELPLALREPLLKRLSRTDIAVLTSQKVLAIGNRTVRTDRKTLQDIDHVVLATGYQANQELIADIKALGVPYKVIGDAIRPRGIHNAIVEGFEAAYGL